MTETIPFDSIKAKFLEHIASYNLVTQCLMDGPEDAEIAIIGEYPGQQEIAFNKPFVGGSGKHLWTTLRQFGITRADVYMTNVVKRQISAKHNTNTLEINLWNEALHYELSLLPNLKYIICLGNAAMSAILGFDGITQYRGSVYDWEGKKVIVANNPALVMRMPQNEIIFTMDMEKVSRVIKGEYKRHHVNGIINPSYQEAMEYLDQIKRVHKRFSMDIEVTGMETACIGVGISAHEAMCINFRDTFDNRFTIEEEYNVVRKFLEVCDDPSTFVIAQNGNFDSYFMGYKDHARFRVNFDTLLAHHTLYPRLPHNLGFLTSQYTDHPYYKDEKDKFKEGGHVDSFWQYNATDCAITYAVAEKEEQELKDQKLHDFFINHVMRINPHLTEATVTGIAVDIDRKAQLSQELRPEIDKLERDFLDAVRRATHDPNYVINPRSSQQKAALMFDVLKCTAKKRSTDADTLETILKDPRASLDAKEVITTLSRYSTEQKFFSTYVETQIDSDDRFRAEFKQYGVSKAPGRLSSSQTLWGSGGNAQNQPKRAYEMYVADQGCVFIYFDLAQAEARYVAWDAAIDSWKEDFERARLGGDYDAHRALASKMYKVPYDEVPMDDEDANGHHTIRFFAKRCRHGLNYRMHFYRLAQTTGMSNAEAAQNYFKYHNTTPEVQVWWKNIESEIRRNRMLFNCYGRRFIAMERLEDNDIMDSIVAFKPQSSIGDKTQRVWYQCHEDERWDRNKARIAINVHDALYGIATPDFAMTALSIMKAYAEEPLMVKETKSGKVNPMIIPADMKMSVAGPDGFHRMSNMKKLVVEPAKIITRL